MDNIQYRNLFDQAPGNLFITDSTGMILDINQNCCQMLGSAAQELIDNPFSRFISGEHRDRFGHHLARLATQKKNSASQPDRNLTLQHDGLPPFYAALVPL